MGLLLVFDPGKVRARPRALVWDFSLGLSLGRDTVFVRAVWVRGCGAPEVSGTKGDIYCLETLPNSKQEKLYRKGFCIFLPRKSEMFYILSGL